MKAINKPFTITDLLRFTHYYSHNRMKAYIKVLMDLGYIVESGRYWKKNITYIISESGVNVICDMNRSYEIEIMKFCNEYNIEL